MKQILILFNLLLVSFLGIAQCNCDIITRADGDMLLCPSKPIAGDSKVQVGVTVSSNFESDFILITVRFKGTAKDVSDDLRLVLSDNNAISLKLINSVKSYIGESQVTQAVFALSGKDKFALSKANLKTISVKMSDGLFHVYRIELNDDVLLKQVKCL